MAATAVNARDTAPALSALAMTAASVYQAGRAFLFNCTGAGTITVTFQDGSTLTFTAASGTVYEYNWSIVSYTLSSATGAVYNLY